MKGHAGQPENERCDELANEAAYSSDLLPDHGFVAEEARNKSQQDLF